MITNCGSLFFFNIQNGVARRTVSLSSSIAVDPRPAKVEKAGREVSRAESVQFLDVPEVVSGKVRVILLSDEGRDDKCPCGICTQPLSFVRAVNIRGSRLNTSHRGDSVFCRTRWNRPVLGVFIIASFSSVGSGRKQRGRANAEKATRREGGVCR